MLTPYHKEELKRICSSILFDICIAPYTTFKVGGNVNALCDVAKPEILSKLVRYLHNNGIPYFIIGNGSNIMMSDSGFNGVIIRLRGEFEKISHFMDDNRILLKVGAGVNISHLLRYCVSNGLTGIEFLAGIPGTVGGAVAMNAGAFGKEIGRDVEKITILTPSGTIVSRNRSELSFSYRSMYMQAGYIITYVWLKLIPSDKGVIKRKISHCLHIRSESQPLDYPSAGCIFKNPDGNPAGKLIDEAGLKGKSIGGAMISRKHANFIINTGNATTQDIMTLINFIKNKIKEKKGIDLEPEIRFVGFG